MRKTNRPCASRGKAAAAWRVSAALVALTSLGSGHLASAQEIPAIPIPQQPFAQPVPRFIGQPAIPQPITALPVPEDPYMAPNGRSNIHVDAYQSDTYATGGPLGHAPTVKSATLLGIGGTVTFDSAGRIVVLVLGNGPRRLFLLDPVTLGAQWVLDLPPSSSSGTAFGGGGYYFLDELDRAVIPTVNQQIWIVQVRKSPPYLEHVNTCDLSQLLGQQISGQSIQSVFPDAQGLLWFTTSGLPTPNTQNGPATSPALVGTLVFKGSNQCTVKTVTLARSTSEMIHGNESISKSFAVDPVPAAQGQGGVFIVSDYAMYRFDAAADGTPQITWREAYDRGTPPPKPGQIQVGSGTTPTLMGTDFVTIANNASPKMDVLVYRRAAQVQGSRLVCRVPVFEKDMSASENSLIATNQSIVVENNYGYYGPQATLFNRAIEPGGITRIDLNADQSGCHIVWTNPERVPSVVSQMSLANGLIYTYTKDPNSCSTPGPCFTAAWYLTAIDFASGQTIFKRLGGTGLFYNNHYSGVYLGPDQKTAYVGVIGGLIAIRDRY
jgi:hypothetical protein